MGWRRVCAGGGCPCQAVAGGRTRGRSLALAADGDAGAGGGRAPFALILRRVVAAREVGRADPLGKVRPGLQLGEPGSKAPPGEGGDDDTHTRALSLQRVGLSPVRGTPPSPTPAPLTTLLTPGAAGRAAKGKSWPGRVPRGAPVWRAGGKAGIQRPGQGEAGGGGGQSAPGAPCTARRGLCRVSGDRQRSAASPARAEPPRELFAAAELPEAPGRAAGSSPRGAARCWGGTHNRLLRL